MKNLYLLFAAILLCSFQYKMPGPLEPASYEVEITLKNQETIKGFLISAEIASEWSDEQFTEWIILKDDYHNSDSIRISTQHYFFKHPRSGYISYSHQIKNLAKNQVAIIHKIKTYKGWEWHPWLSEHLTTTEIEQMLSEPVSKLEIPFEGEEIHGTGDYSGYFWLFSYNPKIGNSELKKISDQISKEYYSGKSKAKEWYDISYIWQDIREKYRSKLRKKQVIFFTIVH